MSNMHGTNDIKTIGDLFDHELAAATQFTNLLCEWRLTQNINHYLHEQEKLIRAMRAGHGKL